MQKSSTAFVLLDNKHDHANNIQQPDATIWCNIHQPDGDLKDCYGTALRKLYLLAACWGLCRG